MILFIWVKTLSLLITIHPKRLILIFKIDVITLGALQRSKINSYSFVIFEKSTNFKANLVFFSLHLVDIQQFHVTFDWTRIKLSQFFRVIFRHIREQHQYGIHECWFVISTKSWHRWKSHLGVKIQATHPRSSRHWATLPNFHLLDWAIE